MSAALSRRAQESPAAGTRSLPQANALSSSLMATSGTEEPPRVHRYRRAVITSTSSSTSASPHLCFC